MTSVGGGRAIARSVADELADREDVDGVLLVGSVALGYADEYSDVDLEVVGADEGGDRTVEGVRVEWTPVSLDAIEEQLVGWANDDALYTYARAEVLYDEVGVAGLLREFDAYPDPVRREKLFAGWYYGTGAVLDARKAVRRGNDRVQQCAAVSAVEQFARLPYVLEVRFPPYQSWLFREPPMELPSLDRALTADLDALEAVMDRLEEALTPELPDDRLAQPYRYSPEFGPLG